MDSEPAWRPTDPNSFAMFRPELSAAPTTTESFASRTFRQLKWTSLMSI